MAYIITDRENAILEDAIRRGRNIRGGPGVRVQNTADGILISLEQTRFHKPEKFSTFRARITAVSGSFPTWSYTVQRVTGYNSSNTGYLKWTTDGTDITGVLNRCEFGPQSGYPYTHGTGVTVTASDGTVNSGSCKIKAIGTGSVVDVSILTDQSGNTSYSFYAANSAQ